LSGTGTSLRNPAVPWEHGRVRLRLRRTGRPVAAGTRSLPSDAPTAGCFLSHEAGSAPNARAHPHQADQTAAPASGGGSPPSPVPSRSERTRVAHVVPGSRDPAVGTLNVRDAKLVDVAAQGSAMPLTCCRPGRIPDTGYLRRGLSIAKAFGRMPFSTWRQPTGAAIGNPGRAPAATRRRSPSSRGRSSDNR
jgi:hypothetical protein